MPLATALGAGRYHLMRFLGEGAMKRVYLAHDTRLDADVAVAIVRAEELDADGRVRVSREARAMARLRDHPNIVPVFDIGEVDEQPFIVSQYMDAGSVDDLICSADRHRLPVSEAMRIAEQVAAGLDYAHRQGIVHRDLKPGNVWLTRDGVAKLGDFGLAVALDQTRITQEGMIVGTVAYLAPEQAMGATPDAKSDLYGLGAMLYEMLAGRPPFLGDDAVTVISQHLNTPAVAPSRHNPQVPAALDALVLQLLEKDPAKRPANARATIDALQQIASTAAALTTPADPDRLATRPRTVSGRFVGRREELEQLKQAFENAVSGQGCLAMVAGEAGIGKTRLAEEFAVYARLRGGQVLTGRSYEEAAELPYSPFVEALHQYVRSRRDPELRQDLGAVAPEVAELVSEIRRRLPDLPPSLPLQGEAERLRLFDGVTRFLQSAAASVPLVLHLDDLHWAGKPSLLLLRYLARNLSGVRLLVVCTYRDVELDRTHPLAELLPALRREANFRRIVLSGLTEPEVLAFVSALADDAPDEPARAARAVFAKKLREETEGNPFFVGEVLAHFMESGKLIGEQGRWTARVSSIAELGIPEGVREVVGRRVSALSSACAELLTIASAMPAGFSWKVMIELCTAPEAELLDALDEAISARLLRERRDERQTRYEFTHVLIRHTLYEDLTAPRRVLLHRRIAERLQAIHDAASAPLTELAYHFFQAAPGGDIAKAVHYAMRAGERAASLAAYEEAAGHFDRALQALDLAPTQDLALRCDVLLALADAHASMGARDRSRESAGRAAELARSIDQPAKLALAALHFGGEHVFFSVVRDEARLQLLEEALRALDGMESELIVRLLRRLALEHLWFDRARSESFADQALEVARRSEEPRALAYALGAKHAALSGTLRHHERIAIGLEILGVAREAGLTDLRSTITSILHTDLLELGDAPAARAQLDALAALATQRRQPTTLWVVTFLRGLWALVEGRFEDAERHANEALDLARRTDQLGGGVPIHAIQIARVRAERGSLEEMIPDIERENARLPNAAWVSRLAQIHAELGHEPAARSELDKLAANDFRDVPSGITWLGTLCSAAEACARLRDLPRTEILYGLLLPHAARNIVVASATCNGPVSRPLGLLAAALGRFDDAERHFEHALEMNRRLGAPPLIARVRCDYAQMLLDRNATGDRAKALYLAGQAHATAVELGMKLVAERALALRTYA